MASNAVARHVLRAARSQRPLMVRNALLRDGEKEPLSCVDRGHFKWYSCGPTVYDDAHLGHARAYVSFDIIRRVIASLTGARIDYALGVTDIDDKILQRASETGSSPTSLASRFEKRFFEDMSDLNILPPTKVLRVTEHIEELQKFVSDLIDSDAAYPSEKGNVYFAVKSSGDRYGQLDPSRGLCIDNVETQGAENEHLDKRDPRDFALWKHEQAAQSLGSGTWDSPWGAGRPGWHVECSAMATSAVGSHLDMHTGGIDLRFPHHTNELATAEAKLCIHKLPPSTSAEPVRWSHTWLHAGHLHLQGRKMSKSVKNFVTVREFLGNGGSADAFRIFCLLHRYSSPVEYSEDRLTDAQSYISRIRRFLDRHMGNEVPTLRPADATSIWMHPGCSHAQQLGKIVRETEDAIEEALTDDFDTPKAMSKISKLITAANGAVSNEGEWVSGAAALAHNSAREVVRRTLGMLGISDNTLVKNTGSAAESDKVGEIIDAYVNFRSGVRDAARRKDIGAIFELCDGARDDALNDFGIRVADKKGGSSTWTRS